MTDSTLTQNFRAEVVAKVGVPAELVPVIREQGEIFFDDFSGVYPDGPSYARALGLGEPGEHARGSRAFRERQNALDRYSRWRRGGRRFSAERTSVPVEILRQPVPATAADVLRLMVAHGATVTSFRGKFAYSKDPRTRNITAGVYIWPEVLGQAGFAAASRETPLNWDWLARAFFNAWAFAYGLDDQLLEAIEPTGEETGAIGAFTFDIGRGDDYLYDYPYMTGGAA